MNVYINLLERRTQHIRLKRGLRKIQDENGQYITREHLY